MADWRGNRYVRLGIGSFVAAVALSMAAPPSMAAAGAVRPKPSGSTSNPQRNTPDIKHRTTPGRAGPGNPAPPQSRPAPAAPGSAARPPQAQRKDKPPDRDPHKYSPQRRTPAGQSTAGRSGGSSPKVKVGADRPADRSPNKVAPQRRTPAASAPDRRDNKPRDQVGPRAPAQRVPGRVAVSGSVLRQWLTDWRARTPKTAKKTRGSSLVYRYQIKNGLPVRLLDNDDPRYDPDKDRDGIVDEDFNPPHEVWDVSRPGGYVIPIPLKPGMRLPINDHSFLPKRGNTAVIGRLVDTAKWTDTPGYDVLNVPDWTLAKNDMWVRQIIHNRQTVYVATPPTPESRWDSVKNRPTVFGREITMLEDAGYTWDGDFLRPPPRPQARPGGRLLPPPGR